MLSRLLFIFPTTLVHFARQSAALQPPAPKVTPDAPRWQDQGPEPDLKKRDDLTTVFVAPDNVCGYKGGNSADNVTCVASSMSCVIVSRDGRADVGCCSDFVECPNQIGTSVIGFDEASDSGFCNFGRCDTSSAGSQVVICQDSSYTEVYEYTLAGVSGMPAIGRACYTMPQVTTDTLYTTYVGQSGITWASTVLTPPTTSTPAPTTNSATPTAEPNDKNVGAIAGGVVGGIAVLAIAGTAIFCLLRKSKKQHPIEQPHWQPSDQMREQPAVAPDAPGPYVPAAQTGYWQQYSSPTGPSMVPFSKSPVTSTTGPASPVSQVPSDYSPSQAVYHSQSPDPGIGAWQQQQQQQPQYSPPVNETAGVGELGAGQGGYEHHRMQELPIHRHSQQ